MDKIGEYSIARENHFAERVEPLLMCLESMVFNKTKKCTMCNGTGLLLPPNHSFPKSYADPIPCEYPSVCPKCKGLKRSR